MKMHYRQLFDPYEPDFDRFTCTCDSYKGAVLRSQTQSGFWHEPYCRHLLDGVRLGLDRGFITVLKQGPGTGRPDWHWWNGAAPIVAKNGELITMVVLDVYLPEDYEHAEHIGQEVWAVGLSGADNEEPIGMVRLDRTGRKLLASLAIPHLMDYAAEFPCILCGKRPRDSGPAPYRKYDVQWAAFLLTHERRCWDCAQDDLIPNV